MAEPEPDWPEAAGQGRPAAPAGEAMPLLSVAGFKGPLDFLFEMVRRHRVDLGPLSIGALTDQFVAALEDSAQRVPLARRSTWLVAASDLVLLKARLLCPETPAVAEAATAEATRRLGHLAELAHMRAAANWLGTRPQLGVRVFARGQMERQARLQAELYVERFCRGYDELRNHLHPCTHHNQYVSTSRRCLHRIRRTTATLAVLKLRSLHFSCSLCCKVWRER